MKTKYAFVFVLFIMAAALGSGCAKSNSELATDNAELKARIQKLEQQLEAAGSPTTSGVEAASVPELKSQLAEAQKQVEAATAKLKSLNDQVEAQEGKIVSLSRQLSAVQQARDEAEKELKVYRAAATSALDQFKALRGTLGGGRVNIAGYHQNYLATQAVVTKLADALPESAARRELMSLLGTFTRVDNICETASEQMQARTKQAKADYDKFVDFGGLGPNRYVMQVGKEKILAPAEQANAATAAKCDQQVTALETDLDAGLEQLQALVNGQST